MLCSPPSIFCCFFLSSFFGLFPFSFYWGLLIIESSVSHFVEFPIFSEYIFLKELKLLNPTYLSLKFINICSSKVEYACLTFLSCSSSDYHTFNDNIIIFPKMPVIFASSANSSLLAVLGKFRSRTPYLLVHSSTFCK